MGTIDSPTTTGPVGHQGARVDITQHPAFAVNGWLGVVVLAGCIAGAVVGPAYTTPDWSGCRCSSSSSSPPRW